MKIKRAIMEFILYLWELFKRWLTRLEFKKYKKNSTENINKGKKRKRN